jgi:ubiquinone/menaquinone biosynthesis C-methylase UbiE
MTSIDAAIQKEIEIQRAYYAETAHHYDDMHVHVDDKHSFALRFMLLIANYFGVRSILDIGSGTGRGLLKIKVEMPGIAAIGIEPSSDLRKIGHSKGLLETELIDGDAMNLDFGDGSFDLVCEFGALHHIPVPSRAVSEMLRVSRNIIFISDCNNFGHGSRVSRLLKQTINTVRLWPIADFIKTKRKGYSVSEGDGLAYSYSVFNDYKQIRKQCKSIHLLNTVDAGPNLYRTASHVALLGVKGPTQS